MQTARDYLVYSCPSCRKRIFTQRSFSGRSGTCPLCGTTHLVGGAPAVVSPVDNATRNDRIKVAEEAPDRRGAKRVSPRHGAEVEVRPAGRRTGRPLDRDQLEPLLDISATGVGFHAQGVPDPRKLSGWKPPPFARGDEVSLTLHSAKIEARPRSVTAVVRRVEATPTKGTWLIGAEFVGLDDEDQAFLRDLLRG